MDLHAKSFSAFPRSGHIGLGLAYTIHLHEKRHIKRVGVAGIALRARLFIQFLGVISFLLCVLAQT
ncbi:hypothetical protein C5L22_00340 [Pantoea ananatis]|nr:hypothetical protein C5L22_00340 [Pantoea ananatis]